MKVFPAMAIIVMAGFCQADHGHELRDRCTVKDKFLNRANSFDSYQDIDSWQVCGKYVSSEEY